MLLVRIKVLYIQVVTCCFLDKMINIYLYYTSNKETADKLITHISFIRPKNPCLFLEQCFLFLKSDVLPVTFILDIIVDNIDIQRL